MTKTTIFGLILINLSATLAPGNLLAPLNFIATAILAGELVFKLITTKEG